jgi:hypothetical protein
MKKDLWAARLSEVKCQEKPETVLILAGNAELTRIAVVWQETPVVRKKRLSACKGDDAVHVWRWLWENASFAKDEFLQRLSVSPDKADRMFQSLAANRVLYPDGTVNSFVQRYLQQRVLNLFKIHRPTRHTDLISPVTK